MPYKRFPHDGPSCKFPIGLTVDGRLCPNEDSDFAGDGQYPPFVIFDVGAQDNLPAHYETRAEAEAALTALLKE